MHKNLKRSGYFLTFYANQSNYFIQFEKMIDREIK